MTQHNKNKPETKRNALSRFFGENDFLLSMLVALVTLWLVSMGALAIEDWTKVVKTIIGLLAFVGFASLIHAIRHAWARFFKKEAK